MSLSFAIASETDASAIAVLRNAASAALKLQYGEGNWSSVATERSVVLSNFMRPKFQKTLMARDGSAMVGTLCLQTKKPWAIDVKYFTSVEKALYLIGMAVHPDWQRKGVGRAIMKEAKRIAREWPSQAIRLDAWDAKAGAGEFYAKCGFREVGRVVYKTAPLVYYEMVL
jgi:GNAT superfamily N-acetyltransferase